MTNPELLERVAQLRDLGGFEAAVEDADEPAWAQAVIVCSWGPRFPAAGVIVFRRGHPATRKTHDDPYIRPAC
jgi:hypothetical protein